jgi:hypothetical protein
MISKESQEVVDNLVSGYIKMFAEVDAEITEPGNVWVNKKFADTHNLNVDTDSYEDQFVLKITDDDDPSSIVEEIYEDLEKLTDRIAEINTMSEED